MEITLDNLEKAICHFYSNGSSQNELNEWLTSAQSSRQAWVFSWQLLDRSKVILLLYVVTEIEFFLHLSHFCFSRWKSSILEPARYGSKSLDTGMKSLLMSMSF